ncbi:unnamed protein product [Ilex paraguariensis]|uniref:Uncharacterized protein n=1 Tax=Ilex paraguariensis TaxID=185542 RepID=A0ABC8U9M7_9AQUA
MENFEDEGSHSSHEDPYVEDDQEEELSLVLAKTRDSLLSWALEVSTRALDLEVSTSCRRDDNLQIKTSSKSRERKKGKKRSASFSMTPKKKKVV